MTIFARIKARFWKWRAKRIVAQDRRSPGHAFKQSMRRRSVL